TRVCLIEVEVAFMNPDSQLSQRLLVVQTPEMIVDSPDHLKADALRAELRGDAQGHQVPEIVEAPAAPAARAQARLEEPAFVPVLELTCTQPGQRLGPITAEGADGEILPTGHSLPRVEHSCSACNER